MKRFLYPILVFVAVSLIAVPATAQKKSELCVPKQKAKKVDVECPAQKKLDKDGIKACKDTGCGNVDTLLNQQKNTTQGNPNSFEDIKFSEMADLPICIDEYKGIGDNRKPLRDAREGEMVRLVAWALDSRPQNTRDRKKRGESCNCGFTGVDDPENTDVHIVLVDDEILKLRAKATKKKPPSKKFPKGVPARSATYNTLKLRESASLTAEYAPRVRVALKKEFDGAKLKTLINPGKAGRLQVRITGLLMYDSEHAYQNALVRHSNWEIHPVFRLEYCPKGKDCPEKGTAGWIDINNEP